MKVPAADSFSCKKSCISSILSHDIVQSLTLRKKHPKRAAFRPTQVTPYIQAMSVGRLQGFARRRQPLSDSKRHFLVS